MNDFDKKSSEMARAAWLYYTEELTQSQIADRLGVSRSTVIRLLQKAKQSGLVTITLGVSTDTFEVERDLEKRFNLKKVRIVPEAMDEVMQRRWIGQVAGETLTELARDGSTITVSWGSTLQFMADSLTGDPGRKDMRIVALMGGLQKAIRGTNPHEVAEQLGQYFRAPATALYAPIYVRDAATAQGLVAEPGLQAALDLSRKASLAVFSLGGMDSSATMLKLGYVNAEEERFLREHGAVGELASRWIDRDGKAVPLPPTINPISISLDDMRCIPERLLVAGGQTKTGIIRACLKGGFATHLVTDEGVAAALLAG